MTKVTFELVQDEDGWPPVAAESCHATPVEDGLRVDNIPFFAHGVAFGDVVKVDPVTGVYLDHHSYSGNSTVRLLFDSDNPAGIEEITSRLASLGCSHEGSHLPCLIAIDIPAGVPYPSIRMLLEEWESAGILEYQESCIWDEE